MSFRKTTQLGGSTDISPIERPKYSFGASPEKNPTPKKRSWFRRLMLSVAAVVALFLLWLFAVWPPPIWYRWFWPRQTAFMEMREDQADSLLRHRQARRLMVDGKLRRRYDPVPLAQIDQNVVQAVLIAEDNRFFEHGGIDYLAILHALGYRLDQFDIGNPRNRQELYRAFDRAWDRRDRLRGASTITQQLAKNLYLSPSRNPLRKVKEAVTAVRLELVIPKSRLLELYLNVVEFGPEIWGVSAAADTYFGRSAANLTSEQAAALAGTLPFPMRSNPGFRPRRMERRKQLILRRMYGDPIPIPEEFQDSVEDDGDNGDE